MKTLMNFAVAAVLFTSGAALAENAETLGC